MSKKSGNIAIPVLLFVLIAIGVLIVINTKLNLSPMPGRANAPQPPSIVEKLLKPVQEIDEHNPDGTMKLIMHSERQTDGSTIYTFFISDIDGGNKKLIFTKTAPKDMSMAIHHNSFSPDNKLVLIEEHNGTAINYFVLKASGEPFANGQQYLDIRDLYTEKKIQYTFDDVTGWAGPTLAIVRTKKEDNSRGPAFWFVTDSRAFLQLAR